MMRRFEERDYADFCAWCEAHGGGIVERDVLPTLGLIVEGVAALFLVQTDTAVAFAHHLTTNPAAGLRERTAAVAELADGIKALARELGFRYLLTWSGHRSVVRQALRSGGRMIESPVSVIATAL